LISSPTVARAPQSLWIFATLTFLSERGGGFNEPDIE
jgi:hypothetical protein